MTADEAELLHRAAAKAQTLADELDRQAKTLDADDQEGRRRLETVTIAAIHLARRLSPPPLTTHHRPPHDTLKDAADDCL